MVTRFYQVNQSAKQMRDGKMWSLWCGSVAGRGRGGGKLGDTTGPCHGLRTFSTRPTRAVHRRYLPRSPAGRTDDLTLASYPEVLTSHTFSSTMYSAQNWRSLTMGLGNFLPPLERQAYSYRHSRFQYMPLAWRFRHPSQNLAGFTYHLRGKLTRSVCLFWPIWPRWVDSEQWLSSKTLVETIPT